MTTIDREAARQRLLSDLATHDTADIRAWLRDMACEGFADLPLHKLPTWALVWTVGRLRLDVSCAGLDLRCANLDNANLDSADLRGANLDSADLRGANLDNADLRGANLDNADLRGANLDSADLRGANLDNADLRGANLDSADLRGTKLYGADLRKAKLTKANLHEADLSDTDLREALYNAKTRWPKGFDPEAAGAVRMTIDREVARQRLINDLAAHDTAEIRAWLRDVACEDYAHMLDLPLQDVPTWALVWAAGRFYLDVSCAGLDLRGANLQVADLSGSDLRWANLTGADLFEADLEESDLRGVNLRGATLRSAHLRKANLHGANLHGADLRGADLFESDLTGARYDACTCWPKGFSPESAGAVREG